MRTISIIAALTVASTSFATSAARSRQSRQRR